MTAPAPLPIEIAPALSRRLGVGHDQWIYRFSNGYGASVVQGPHTYGGPDGLYELAVVAFCGYDPGEFSLTYDTPITGNVLGHLTVPEVAGALARIAALPAGGAS